MMLDLKEYKKLCKETGISKQGNYNNGYKYCNEIYQNQYINKIVLPILKKIEHKKRIVFLFLESCPHSTKNYIFDNLYNYITYRNDSYLWNICTGFGINPKGFTKFQCLSNLVNYQHKDENIPIILLDLFPFHGIGLNSNIRRTICNNINNKYLLIDAINYMDKIKKVEPKSEILFLFAVPCTIWNYSGGYGNGSLYCNANNQIGLLGMFNNKSVVMNVGGQYISSMAIKDWVSLEL